MVNWNLIFIDCIQFMNSILDALVKDLKWNDMDFKYLLQKFSGELLELLKSKVVYLWEYMNNFKKVFNDKLSNRCKFFCSPKDKYISKKDYLHAVDVWNLFKMKTLDDHHDLCLKNDVFLVPDVLGKLPDVCLE